MCFYRHTNPIARKEHICEYCGEKIEKGQKYSYETGLYDGEIFTRKLCSYCENIMFNYFDSNGYGEFDWDWIDDWINSGICYDCSKGSHSGDDSCDCDFRSCEKVRKILGNREGNVV